MGDGSVFVEDGMWEFPVPEIECPRGCCGWFLMLVLTALVIYCLIQDNAKFFEDVTVESSGLRDSTGTTSSLLVPKSLSGSWLTLLPRPPLLSWGLHLLPWRW